MQVFLLSKTLKPFDHNGFKAYINTYIGLCDFLS
jgi:hypothetical protein